MSDKMQQSFHEWAEKDGNDMAHTYDTSRSVWVYFHPLTADLWDSWQAAWQAARTVPDEAVSILADVIRELENGFVRCETCGDQEDTATLDCMDELRRVHYMLSAAPEPKK